MNVLILGANGFIGSHLSEAILAQTDWQIHAMDLAQDKIETCLQHPRFHFVSGDITKQKDWIRERIQHCDVILPLVAVATPALYVQDPLRVFELDFEANLEIVRQCAEYKKHVIFPSTSEVYGMCPDTEFDEENSNLVTGPINKERWIYSTSKQLLDRVIYAYGKHKGLSYTLFRPFNWYGPRLDNVFNPKPGGSRVLTQFIGNILRGENINLVNGGSQQRCFTYVGDGVDALLRIIKNKNDSARNKIFNIGNPSENISIRKLAETLISLITQSYPNYAERAKSVQLVDIDAQQYYGEGYQDVSLRVPLVRHANEQLGWTPQVSMETGLRATLDFYLN
ncbi:bifunctional UDP-4-keto-pentose/UDP-xylose synthase [Aquicella lusitana]|uniref:Nucleoside-diphosphate-sugar epimerase n=1 Tax=Aquicella lusitana TaxID=254246 RepID=A0A370G5X5_9COXI|nr:bifunctional UDP-4-keto-pentose/UDP-xylose synthase [Aquicella lusitana]RDI38456.1 nucleoside-diphosphate-sugar epimerase [Aquicella lusitana]VVC73765.1 Bifunctional polymyxin resistance protein ArnA [Aquicella lusitana]